MSLIKLTMIGTREQASPLALNPGEPNRIPTAVDERDIVMNDLYINPAIIHMVTSADTLPMQKSCILTAVGGFAIAEEAKEVARLFNTYADL